MARLLCDDCGKRRAVMFRLSRKFRKGKSARRHLIIKASPDHPLCRQCHLSRFESEKQASKEAELQAEINNFMKEQELTKKIIDLVADEMSCDESEVTPNADLSHDLGADSLDKTEIVIRIEEEFDIDCRKKWSRASKPSPTSSGSSACSWRRRIDNFRIPPLGGIWRGLIRAVNRGRSPPRAPTGAKRWREPAVASGGKAGRLGVSQPVPGSRPSG